MDGRGHINFSRVLSQIQKRMVLIFSLLLLLTIVLGGCGIALPQESSESTGSVIEEVAPASEVRDMVVPESSYYAANPELNAAHRYTAVVKDESQDMVILESSYYAANPELNAARRYTAVVKDQLPTDSTFYAANPELMAAERYANSHN